VDLRCRQGILATRVSRSLLEDTREEKSLQISIRAHIQFKLDYPSKASTMVMDPLTIPLLCECDLTKQGRSVVRSVSPWERDGIERQDGKTGKTIPDIRIR
jgi:hypothetical protein